ncbi:MAG: sodium:proton antiporter [Planctomycetaceae bacterium]
MASTLSLLASGSGHPLPPYWSVIPFLITLLGIAILPLVAHHRWESNRFRAGFTWTIAIPTAGWWLWRYDATALLHAGEEYLAFIMLLGSLYVASGGIYIRGSLRGRPATNVGICLIGSVIANLIGTTGASMLLIRPFLKANAHRSMRSRSIGVIFFIFSVSNIGGCLTPLGDPPLFLGFLRGVEFQWPFLNLIPDWSVALSVVFTVYFLWDRRLLRSDPAAPPPQAAPEGFGLDGARNAFILLGVIAMVLGKGIYKWPFGVQEAGMGILALLSLKVTPKAVRTANRFTFGPMLEVAILFSGIFTTMVPALAILDVKGSEMGLEAPWHFFWATGLLSSFLDNAPTYLTMATTAVSQTHATAIGELSERAPHLLAAISCGAVFMGANTYIGNGPNFMVRAIAVENGVAMPSFFGYMRYSALILLPIFVLLSFLFFR